MVTYPHSLAEASRPHRAFRESLHDPDSCGRKRKPENMIPTDAVCVNWQHPLLWSQIILAATKVGYTMSPIAIAMELKRRNPGQFAKITPQVIGTWIDRSSTCPVWKPEVIQRAQKGNQPPGHVNRRNILSPYPHIISGIIDQLRKLRKAGVPLNIPQCRGIMVARLHHAIPEVFQVIAKDGSVFRCSESWVKHFIYQNLKWSFRRSTRASQKTPANADELCHQQFLRHAITARDTVIPTAGFRVNIDQMNIVYQCATSSTYEDVGASQVAVVGKDEKRAFTLLIGISDSGDALPFQAIFQGTTQRSCPSRKSALYDVAMNLGFKFEFSNTDTYWSTFDLMCKYVCDILVPYFTEQKKRARASDDQECILQLDVWAVHRSVTFRTWLDQNYPWIIYLFVPGGCTGIAQPCDVGIQRPLKLSIKHSQHADVVDETLGYLKDGTDPAELQIDTRIGTLRDRTVGWMVRAYHTINKPELVRKVRIIGFWPWIRLSFLFQAFEMCKAGKGFNLSFESITNHKTLLLLCDIQKNKPELWSKITSLQYNATNDTEEVPDDISDEEDKIEDEIDVPVDVVMAYMCSGGAVVPEGFVLGTDGALRAKNESEEYEQPDEIAEEPEEIEYGRGKRRAIVSANYKDFWHH